MNPPVAGVIFDLDGVLIDSEELHYHAYRQVLRQFGVDVGREEYAVNWIAKGRGPEYAVARYGLPLTPDELRQWKNPVYHRLLRERVRLMPAARKALEHLGARFPLALATNSSEKDTSFVLDHLHMRAYFCAVVTREAYVLAKPEPDAFLAASAALSLPPSNCVVIEDAFKGVVAAHRAGCPCVAVPNGFTCNNDFSLAKRVVPSLAHVTAELVEELTAPGATAS